MGFENVKEQIDEINRLAESGDFEAAHAAEDQLRKDFIKAIADGYYPRMKPILEIAKLVLVTEEWDFPRHCA